MRKKYCQKYQSREPGRLWNCLCMLFVYDVVLCMLFGHIAYVGAPMLICVFCLCILFVRVVLCMLLVHVACVCCFVYVAYVYVVYVYVAYVYVVLCILFVQVACAYCLCMLFVHVVCACC